MRSLLLLLLLLPLCALACGNASSSSGSQGPEPDAGPPADQDASDAADAADAADGAEPDCTSDPKDAGEGCYACGWAHNDPGSLVSTGAEVGDVIKNLPFIDQCGEAVHLWDFAGAYHILDMTGAWCASCVVEAGGLAAEGEAFTAETGVPFSWMLVLFQDGQGNPPNAAFPAKFATELKLWSFPVLGDQVSGVLSATPYNGSVFPGKCALSPEMEILHCYSGEDDEEGFEAIRQHAGVGSP